MIPNLPFALRTDGRWQRGVPGAWPAAGTFLRELTGRDFPVLSHLRHARVRRCIASMLRENLDASTSVLGLGPKLLAGAVFAITVKDAQLASDMRALGPKQSVSPERFDEAEAFARGATLGSDRDARDAAVLTLARAASPSPAAIDEAILDACQRAPLGPAAIVELATWLSVLQMLHRLSSYYSDVAGRVLTAT